MEEEEKEEEEEEEKEEKEEEEEEEEEESKSTERVPERLKLYSVICTSISQALVRVLLILL